MIVYFPSPFTEREPELTDEMLLILASCITGSAELRVLGFHGLNMEFHRVDAHLSNSPHSITDAAYEMIREWRLSQPDRKQAYRSLCGALKDANMALLIERLH